MKMLLRSFLEHIVARGALDVETASGQRFMVGDRVDNPVAVRFVDQAAERELLLNPGLALGELYVEGRLIIARGSVYDLLDLIASNLAWQIPPGFARAQDIANASSEEHEKPGRA